MADTDLQARQNAEYRRALRELSPAQKRRMMQSLSPEDQEKARKHGLERVLIPDYDSEQGRVDVSDWTSLAAPVLPTPERLADVLAERFNVPPTTATLLAALFEKLVDAEADRRKSLQLSRIVAGLVRTGNVAVRTHGLAIAAQLDVLNNLGYDSLTSAGKVLGTSKANMSKVVNEWCDLLELPRPPMLKSQQARATYSKLRKAHHWRKDLCQTKPPKHP